MPVPSAQRRETTGQDVRAWLPFVDVLYPMTYHAILQRSPEWIGSIVDELRAQTGLPIVPVVQLTAAPEFADPWDWGQEFGVTELADVLQHAGAGGPIATFPGTALGATEAALLSQYLASGAIP